MNINLNRVIYPGSFNPAHEGHVDIVKKALKCFDQVIVSIGKNPDKKDTDFNLDKLYDEFPWDNSPWISTASDLPDSKVVVCEFNGLLVDHIKNVEKHVAVSAIIRGLRNGSDLQYETNQQYWNEDLGIEIPTIYFICDRKLSHISSSTIRALRKYHGDDSKIC